MKLSAGRVARSHEEASSSSEQIATERLLLAHAAQVHSRLQDLRISQQKACILNSATRQRAVSAINSLISTLQNARNEIDTEVDQTETRNDAICAQLEMNLQAEIQGLSLVEARLRDRKRTPDTVQAAIHNAHSRQSARSHNEPTGYEGGVQSGPTQKRQSTVFGMEHWPLQCSQVWIQAEARADRSL